MWSFIASVLMFLGMVGGLGAWQRTARRAIREQAAATERQIARAAEVAQRRHLRRYGSTSQDLTTALQNHHQANGLAK
jgi:hypothetical protein